MMGMLNPGSKVPLYIQLNEYLRKQIDIGAYPIGARLPSERELAETNAVSRMTARQALQLLIQQGYADSRVGKGTFATLPKIKQELTELTGFSEEMRRRGMRPSSRVLRAEVRLASDEIAERLQLQAGSEIVVLIRTRHADETPVALEESCLNHQLCPGILALHDFNRESLYQVLRANYGLRLAWASQAIEARLPTRAECEALAIKRSEPVLSLTRVTFDDADRPIEYARSAYCGSRYQFKAILRGSSS